jgi:protein kinase A
MVEEEKQFIARFSEQHHPLPPEDVQQDPRNKELGRSSRGLSVKDFDLVRTLGTGVYIYISS